MGLDNRDLTKEKQSPLQDFTIPSTLSWLADILKLRKGLIIWAAWKERGGGVLKTFAVLFNSNIVSLL